jgi:hypothetical protein
VAVDGGADHGARGGKDALVDSFGGGATASAQVRQVPSYGVERAHAVHSYWRGGGGSATGSTTLRRLRLRRGIRWPGVVENGDVAKFAPGSVL